MNIHDPQTQRYVIAVLIADVDRPINVAARRWLTPSSSRSSRNATPIGRSTGRPPLTSRTVQMGVSRTHT